MFFPEEPLIRSVNKYEINNMLMIKAVLMKLAVAFRLERAQIQYEFSARCALH